MEHYWSAIENEINCRRSRVKYVIESGESEELVDSFTGSAVVIMIGFYKKFI